MVAVAERPRTLGRQKPRIRYVPDARARSLGHEAVELAASAGLILDEWQRNVLIDACRVRNGGWVAKEVGVGVTRQNGKGSILEARELAGLFCWGERMITHSAHQFDTSLEAFRRLLTLIEDTPELDRQVKRVSRSHGEEGIELKTGQRIRFRTRTKGGGRGFSGDCVILDEAMVLSLFAHGALMPTLSAARNPQLWYTGSAVDQNVHEHGRVFAQVRERGLAGTDPRLAYFEWSLPYDLPGDVPTDVREDPAAWAQANPALGIRVDEDFVATELASLDFRTFAVERLGVGDWPTLGDGDDSMITIAAWDDLRDDQSTLVDPVSFAFDVSPDRRASVAAAGKREDGRFHVEIVENRAGTGWLVARLKDLLAHEPERIVCDGYGPAASIVTACEEAGIRVETFGSREHSQACGHLLDLVDEKQLRHLGTDELRRAIRGAKTRPLGDSWAWSRKNSGVDISPLVASTLALAAAAAPAEAERSWRAF